MLKVKKSVTLIVHTKNEEKNIEACIRSAAKLVDEVIVADMKSSDKTVLLAKKLGARIVKVPDYGFADPARNSVIKKAKFEWVLQLDADERIRVPLANKLRRIVEKNKHDVILIPRKNIIFKKWMRYTGWWPDYQIKLTKKNNINWTDKVHTLPEYTGRVFKLPAREVNSIVHYNHLSVDDYLNKIKRYTRHEVGLLKGKKLSPEKVLDYIEREFYGRYFDSLGFMDGMHGFMLSKFKEFYRFVEFARYWEQNKFKNPFPSQTFYKAVKERYQEKGNVPEIKLLQKRVKELSSDLDTIQSAKFYKLWQYYCRKRDKLLRGGRAKKKAETQDNIDNLEGGFNEKYRKFISDKNLTKADSIYTHVTPEEKRKLYELVNKKDGVYVEIGSYLGASACFIAAAIRDKKFNGKLHCVDPWKKDPVAGERETYEDFLFNTAEFDKYIIPLRGTSFKKGRDFKKKLDYLFIDGDHSYKGVKIDVMSWFPKLKKGGIIIFHDIGWAKGVQKVVEELKNQVTKEGRLHNLYWAYKK